MRITIEIDGVERVYEGEYEELHVKDWRRIIQDFLDDRREEF